MHQQKDVHVEWLSLIMCYGDSPTLIVHAVLPRLTGYPNYPGRRVSTVRYTCSCTRTCNWTSCTYAYCTFSYNKNIYTIECILNKNIYTIECILNKNIYIYYRVYSEHESETGIKELEKWQKKRCTTSQVHVIEITQTIQIIQTAK